MHTIQVSVRDKIATQTDGTVIINGNSDYSIEFDFDAEWADLNNKIGIFAYNDAAAHKWAYQTVMFSGNSCTVPILRDIHCVYVGVTAGNVRVTTPAKVQCRLSISDYADTEEPPSADVWGQILAKLDELQTEIDEIKAGGGGGTDISLGVTATVGQTIKVKAVDTNGKPTAWEAVDMATGDTEVWEKVTFIIPEDAPVPVLTINLPSQDVVKANIFISLFGALKATKFTIMAFIGGTSGSDTLLADINNFYDSSQQIRNAAIAIEKQGDFWRVLSNPEAAAGRRNGTGALRFIKYKSDYLYIKTPTLNETFYGSIEIDYVTGGII